MLNLPPRTEKILWLFPLLLVAYATFTGLRALSVRGGQFGQISRSAVLRVVSMTAFWFALGMLLSPSERFVVMPLGHAIGLLVSAIYLAMGLGTRGRRLLSAVRPRAIRRAAAGQEGMMAAVTLGQTFSVLGQRLPVLVIAGVYGPVPAGYYALAERIVLAPTILISTAITDVFRQRASALYRQGLSFSFLNRRLGLATFSLSIIGFGVLGATIIPNLALVFGEEWAGASSTVAILILNAAAVFATTPFDSTAIITGQRLYMIVWQSIKFAGALIACGLAVTESISYIVFLLVLVIPKIALFLVDYAFNLYFSSKAGERTS